MILLIPFTRILLGSSIGTTAAIVPLTIGSAPFVTRVIESALKEVDKGVIEAAKSFGASTSQIVFKIMLPEALPSIVSGITLTSISVVGFSAMAGAIGAGGLGDVAIRYGYQMFKTDVLIATVIVLILLVQVMQTIGTLIYKRVSR
jgi:D-methionine transport system permease protein